MLGVVSGWLHGALIVSGKIFVLKLQRGTCTAVLAAAYSHALYVLGSAAEYRDAQCWECIMLVILSINKPKSRQDMMKPNSLTPTSSFS